MPGFTLVRRTTATPERVFDVLADHRTYPSFTPLRRVELEREGEPAPNGVGAIRVLHAVGPPIREEVTDFERPRRFSYRLLSGAPVRDHVATVTLERDGTGTRIVYTVDSTPAVPLGKAVVRGVTKLAIRNLLRGVVSQAERDEMPAPPAPAAQAAGRS